MQCGQFAFVCMYIYIYVYPSHFNCVGAVSVVSSPDYEPRSTGLSVIVLESENGNKGTLHQKRVRQRRKSLTD